LLIGIALVEQSADLFCRRRRAQNPHVSKILEPPAGHISWAPKERDKVADHGRGLAVPGSERDGVMVLLPGSPV